MLPALCFPARFLFFAPPSFRVWGTCRDGLLFPSDRSVSVLGFTDTRSGNPTPYVKDVTFFRFFRVLIRYYLPSDGFLGSLATW